MHQSTHTLTDLAKIVSLAKRHSLIFPSSDIYGGFGNLYDYGPLGALLKNNFFCSRTRTTHTRLLAISQRNRLT